MVARKCMLTGKGVRRNTTCMNTSQSFHHFNQNTRRTVTCVSYVICYMPPRFFDKPSRGHTISSILKLLICNGKIYY